MTSETSASRLATRKSAFFRRRDRGRSAPALLMIAVIAVLALLGWTAGSASASATAQPAGHGATERDSAIPGSLLGGLDLNGYCASIGYDHSEVQGNLTSPPAIGPNAAYGWVCVAAAGSSLPSPYRISRSYADMYLPCRYQYPGQNAAPLLGDPNDAYTWNCVVASSATPPPGGEVTGRVCAATAAACPSGGAGGVDGATVTACALNVNTGTGTVPFFCTYIAADSHGYYAIGNLPTAIYTLTADPPPPMPFQSQQINSVAVQTTSVLTENFSLAAIPGASTSGIEGAFGDPAQPEIDSTWPSYAFYTYGCPGGSFSYKLTLDETSYSKQGTIQAGTVLASGPMTQISQAGGVAHYRATHGQPLAPAHGKASLVFSFTCGGTNGTSGTIPFYIDPSGRVLNQQGRPISGASVTLFFSPIDASGPYTAVPDGSTLMSPGDRHNPQTTGTDGRFGWNVLPGFYKAVATRSGCTGPDLAHSPAYSIPPAVTGVEIRLHCADTTPPDLDLTNHPDRQTDMTSATFTFKATDADSATGITYSCKLDSGAFAPCSSPATFTGLSSGSHTFAVRATDAAGNTSATVRFAWHVGSGGDTCQQNGQHDGACGGGDQGDE